MSEVLRITRKDGDCITNPHLERLATEGYRLVGAKKTSVGGNWAEDGDSATTFIFERDDA